MQGQTIGRLYVVSRAQSTDKALALWNVRCECGKEYVVVGASLRRGRAQPCRCMAHGMCNTPTYIAWQDMKNRCLNSACRAYKNYGGRGITVCEQWMDFRSFFADMGVRPDGTELDRIDNNAGYSAKNCRWISRKINNRNKRTTVLLSCLGRTQCLKDWAIELGIHPSSLKKRLIKGWPLEVALTKKAAT